MTEKITERVVLANRLAVSRARIDEIDPQGLKRMNTLANRSEGMEKALGHGKRLVGGGANRGMILIGNPGLGKTHFMVALARRLIQAGHPVWWRNAQKFVGEVQSSYSNPEVMSREMAIEHALSFQYLFLDDMGKERSSEDTHTLMYELVDGMLTRRRTLIASTNLTDEEFYAQYDDATRDRLKAMCKRYLIEGSSYRVKNGEPMYRD